MFFASIFKKMIVRYDFNVCLCSMASIIKKSSRDPHLFAALKKAEAV